MGDSCAFYNALVRTLLENAYNCYGSDNWDEGRFGRMRFRSRKRAVLKHVFRSLKPFLQSWSVSHCDRDDAAAKFDDIVGSHGVGIVRLYNMLADEFSKRALIEVLAYRILGYRRMKLWTNTPDYWKIRATAASLPTHGEELDTGITNIRLSITDLRQIGYPMTLYTHPLVVTHQFLLNQYAYEQVSPPVWLAQGDCVIDAGAAWGDTALCFAHEVGDQGKVYAFEVEPRNIDILKKNLGLNPELASRVSVVEKALWRTSGEALSFSSCGPATQVSELADAPQATKVLSISIDDFARLLPRVDFIKMDIEGAELPALQGAEQTIRRHKPKMAISLYHKVSDFVDIPAYLASLDVDYSYYLSHNSIYSAETVLYVAPKKIAAE